MPRRFGVPRRISRALSRRLLAFVTGSGFNALITLETQGRKTGRPHRVVLPVYPVDPHRMFAISSYGRRSDWLRNVQATPSVRVTRGGQTSGGSARTITWRVLRRELQDSRKGTPAMPRVASLVRIAFLVRARISETVVEITT